MFRNLKIGQKLLVAFLFMPLLVVGTGWFGIQYVGDSGLLVSSEYAPHVDALMEVKLAVTTAHLDFEELMSGDDTRSMDEVRRLLDEAAWYLDAVIEGGNNNEGHYVPTTDRQLRDQVVASKRSLVRLRAAAESRFERRDSGETGIGSDADQQFDAAFDAFVHEADVAETRAQSLLNTGSDRVRAVQGEARQTMLLVTGLAAALALLLAWGMSRHLTVPVVAAATRSSRMAGGDLREDQDNGLDVSRGDELGGLARDFVAMRSRVRAALGSLQAGSRDVAGQSQQVGTTATEYAATTAQQSRSVQEASTSVEELRQLAESSLRFAREVVDSSEHAVERGHHGVQAIGGAVDAVDGVVTRVEAIALRIRDLSERNQRIRDVVDNVNELAEQSNLLAVNASIEAAQAGEHGRGFSAVAAEVRSLATQSKRAAQQIRTLLADIERATADAVDASKEGAQQASDGRTRIRSVREVVEELGEALESSSERARKIAASAAEQAQATAQVSEALRGIAESARTQLTGVANLESAARRLSELSDEQRRIAEGYTL